MCYELSMNIMLTICDVSKKEKSVNGSLRFELLRQRMSQSKTTYMDLCQHANKYKQVVLENLSRTFIGILRVTHVTWAVN